MLPRPAHGILLEDDDLNLNHNKTRGWALHNGARIIVSTPDPHGICPVGKLSYAEAATVCNYVLNITSNCVMQCTYILSNMAALDSVDRVKLTVNYIIIIYYFNY